MDTHNLMPVLTQETEAVRDLVYCYREEWLFAVRKGVWKLHYITQSAYVGDQPVEHDPPLLFNLEHDPSERFNLAADHPDVITEIEAAVSEHHQALTPYPGQLDSLLY